MNADVANPLKILSLIHTCMQADLLIMYVLQSYANKFEHLFAKSNNVTSLVRDFKLLMFFTNVFSGMHHFPLPTNAFHHQNFVLYSTLKVI